MAVKRAAAVPFGALTGLGGYLFLDAAASSKRQAATATGVQHEIVGAGMLQEIAGWWLICVAALLLLVAFLSRKSPGRGGAGSRRPDVKTPRVGASAPRAWWKNHAVWAMGICLLGVVAILWVPAWQQERDRQARAAAEEARTVDYCNEIFRKMGSYVTENGVLAEGKAWAAETIKTATPARLSRCKLEYADLQKAVDGTIDRRIAARRAWECYDKGHQDAWRPLGGLTIREWEDRLAASCGVQGPIPRSKSAVSR